jgi:hypothetical protein
MRRGVGVLVFLTGLGLLGWILYNLFIERLPEAQGRSPVVPLLVSAAFLYVGFRWMRGQSG